MTMMTNDDNDDNYDNYSNEGCHPYQIRSFFNIVQKAARFEHYGAKFFDGFL